MSDRLSFERVETGSLVSFACVAGTHVPPCYFLPPFFSSFTDAIVAAPTCWTLDYLSSHLTTWAPRKEAV